MPDDIIRKRLKEKALDRWENEGGRLLPETIRAGNRSQAGGLKSEASQPSGLRVVSAVDALASSKR
jgi:hypothetical protein